MNNDTKICPFCGEDIKISAIKCRYCGSMLNKNTIPLNPAQSGKTETYLSPGMRLGDYEIVRLIGEGGMGVVYETIYYGLGEPIKRAIKTVPDVVSKDARSLRRLQKEVIIATSLSHPNIVRVYGLEQYQDIYFITMEYIEGYDFREYLDKQGGKIGVKEIVDVLKGVAEALDYAHGLEKPIIHRDLKPQNLIYDIHNKQLKIVDFGIAAEITDSVTTLTQTKLGTSGSPRYMCYEQYMGEEPAIHMDSYAFGIIIYEALNGEPPFVRGDLLAQHEKKEISSLDELSIDQMNILNEALSKEINKRYTSLSKLINEIGSKRKHKKNVKPPKRNNDKSESTFKEHPKDITLEPKQHKNDRSKTTIEKLDDIMLDIKFNRMNKYGFARTRYIKKLLNENIDNISDKKLENNNTKMLMGLCYYYGCGVKRDKDHARRSWFNVPADKGDWFAQYYKALTYKNWQGYYWDEEEAEKLLKKAAKQNCLDAQFELANKFGYELFNNYD